MPQGSSAVKPTTGLYLYLFTPISLLIHEYSIHNSHYIIQQGVWTRGAKFLKSLQNTSKIQAPEWRHIAISTLMTRKYQAPLSTIQSPRRTGDRNLRKSGLGLRVKIRKGEGVGGALNLMWFKTFFFPRASRPPLGPSSFLCSMYRGKVARGETLGLHLVPRLNVPTAKSSFIHSYLGWFLKKICFA